MISLKYGGTGSGILVATARTWATRQDGGKKAKIDTPGL